MPTEQGKTGFGDGLLQFEVLSHGDIALHCNGEMADMQAVVAAVGPMSDASAVRAARALGRRGAVEPIDIAAAGAELEALTPGMTG